jgi:hypothetical protein
VRDQGPSQHRRLPVTSFLIWVSRGLAVLGLGLAVIVAWGAGFDRQAVLRLTVAVCLSALIITAPWFLSRTPRATAADDGGGIR